MKFQPFGFSLIVGLAAGTFIVGSAGIAGAAALNLSGSEQLSHRVPACCNGPWTTLPDYCVAGTKTPPKAEPSQGGDTVRANNPHCLAGHPVTKE
jgi:hypothetical protein